MHVRREDLSDTTVKLTITADQNVLNQIKTTVLERLGHDVRVPGFRPGKAPAALIEKHLNPSQFQSEFLEQAVNHCYVEAIRHEKLRPVDSPEVSILKFVPFTTVEFAATLESVGDVMLPDYRKFRLALNTTPVTAQDISRVLDDLRQRSATRTPAERAAKQDDEVIIDFKGRDAKSGQPISGADGSAYPLRLGSKQFIPGFEDKLVGLKPNAETEFSLTFPKDYGVADLQGRKVTFAVTVRSVQTVDLPNVDDAFAATVGPFKTVAELKADIKRQLQAEHRRNDHLAYESQLLHMLTEKTKVSIPKVLIDEEMEALEAEEKRNLAYRGQTWQEHLNQEGTTAEAHREKFRPEAVKRLTGGLALAEVAERELLNVSSEELNDHITQLKRQYASDAAMQAELDKPEGRRELASRLLNQKVMDKLAEYAAPKTKHQA